MKNVKISLGGLIESMAEFKNLKLHENKEENVDNLECFIKSPNDELVPINYIIKKSNLPGIKITFENGHTLKCAENHILRQIGVDIFAKDLRPNNTIDTLFGPIKISKIEPDELTTFYDIGVPPPHLFVDANGIIHHNTIITAALSHSIERYGRSLVIVPNVSLVTQTQADYVNMGLDVGMVHGGKKEFGHQHTISTWQSLNSLVKQNEEGTAGVSIEEFLKGMVCVISDECFDGESRVLTPIGYVPIKEIKIGDRIINYSENGSYKEDIVVGTHLNLAGSILEKMYELEFDNGNKIKVTGNHKFLTTVGWIRADELTENQEIISKS